MKERNKKMMARQLGGGLAIAVVLGLSGCVTGPGGPGGTSGAGAMGAEGAPLARSETLYPKTAASAPRLAQSLQASQAPLVARAEPVIEKNDAAERVKMSLGNDRTFRIPQARPAGADDAAGPITVNFENGDIREIVRNLIGDALGEGFVIDPAVTGTVTVRTAKGIKRSDIIPTLEMLLRTVRAVLIKDGNYWRILPESGANLGTATPRLQLRPAGGNGVIILPVRHIGAKELERVMAPFAKQPAAGSIRVDELRNLLFLTGTEAEIRNMLEIAEMFDVSLMSGMSFLVYPLESADVKSVAADWEKIFPAATNPFAGLLRVVPIERMNAILLISPQRDIILEARTWLERLDKGTDAGGGARLYVYYLQYTQAEKLQVILQQAVTGRVNQTSSATVAPGQTATTLGSATSPIAGQPLVTPGNTFNNLQANAAAQRPLGNSAFTGAAGASGAAGQATGLARNANIIADKDRNALLIVATPSEYNAIESAIKKLDTAPKQIAIEVQIAQIQLTGDFSFGLSGLFTGKPNAPVNRLTSANGIGALANAAAGAGFNYTWSVGSAVKAAIDTLQTTSQFRTIASPTLVTLDNQKVSFVSGQQISVTTGTVTTPSSAGVITANTTSTTQQYISTGITVNVTPRVSGNNVFLEINQQTSNAAAAPAGTNPNIDTKSVTTSLMVPNGDTILMGGFIQDSTTKGTAGLPFVSTIPVLGGLFGSQTWDSNRSELIMLITPRIMSTIEDTRSVMDDLRQSMSGIEANLPQISTRGLPTASEARQALKERSSAEKIPSEFNQSLKVQPGNAER